MSNYDAEPWQKKIAFTGTKQTCTPRYRIKQTCTSMCRIKDSVINLSFITNSSLQKHQWHTCGKREKNHFFTKWYQQHWINTSRKLKLYTGIKIHSKIMKGLEAPKQLNKNLSKTLQDIHNGYLYRTSIVQKTRPIAN